MFRQRLLALISALTLVAATALPALSQAATETNISLLILPGRPLAASLSAHPPTVPASQNLRGDNAPESASLMVCVLDERGVVSGWTILVTTADVTGRAGHISADALTLSPGEIWVEQGNPDLSGHVLFETSRGSTGNMSLWSAPDQSGDGEYHLPLNGSLSLPGDDWSGVYSLILTIQGTAP